MSTRNAHFLMLLCVFGIASLLAPPPGLAQEEPEYEIEWLEGPAIATIGSMAEIGIPEGYSFANAKDTQLLLEAMGNPTSGTELGLVVPPEERGQWFVVFEFNDIGYVKDDDKDELDPDAILESIRTGTERANEERERRGWAPLSIVGWEAPPHYDEHSNNLEWAIRGQSEGELVVNYNTRLLGRKGVMSANLVVDPEVLRQSLPDFKHLLDGYTYKEGHAYAEFRKGDKIAKYGLAALVAGGAAAAALKTGLLARFWKVIVVGFLGVVAFLKKAAGKITGRGSE